MIEFMINDTSYVFENVADENKDGLRIIVKDFNLPIGVEFIIEHELGFEHVRFNFKPVDFNMFMEDLKMLNDYYRFKVNKRYVNSGLVINIVKKYDKVDIEISDNTNSKNVKVNMDIGYIEGVIDVIERGWSWYVRNELDKK